MQKILLSFALATHAPVLLQPMRFVEEESDSFEFVLVKEVDEHLYQGSMVARDVVHYSVVVDHDDQSYVVAHDVSTRVGQVLEMEEEVVVH